MESNAPAFEVPFISASFLSGFMNIRPPLGCTISCGATFISLKDEVPFDIQKMVTKLNILRFAFLELLHQFRKLSILSSQFDFET